MNKDKNYYTCVKIRRSIDKVLEENAIMFSKIGTSQMPEGVNELSIKEQKAWAEKKEIENLENAEYLDKDFIGNLLERMGQVG